MIRNAAVAATLLALSACASTQEKPEDLALEAFKTWVKASVEGDAKACFEGLSPSYTSEWLFGRASDNDGVFRDWRGSLSGTARTDLDLWIDFCKKNRAKSGRAESAPDTVLRHPALLALWKAYFEQEKIAVAGQLSRLEIVRAYGDDTGVTVVVRGVGSRTEMYGMALTAFGWKIDNHRPPVQAAQ
jgi:hypothetical protein